MSTTDAIATAAPSARSEFLRGVRLALPIMTGIGAWGLVSGVAMINSGLTFWQSIGMTLIVYAGSAQLACLPLMMAGVPIGIVMLTAGIVNLRFLIYGLGLAPAFRHLPWWKRLGLGYFSADVTYVLFVPRYQEDPHRPHVIPLYLGMVATGWGIWQATSIAGVALAERIPTDWGLELAGALALLALVVPLITGVPVMVGVTVSTLVGLVGYDWPMRLGVIAAVAAGVAAALVTEAAVPKKRAP